MKKYNKDTQTTIQELKNLMHQFVDERDWNQFHNPKNLSMSISIEAAELMEKFQFLTTNESIKFAQTHKREVSHELVDVLSYILSFANVTGIDVCSTFEEKLALSRKKYPIELSKGNSTKYTYLKKAHRK